MIKTLFLTVVVVFLCAVTSPHPLIERKSNPPAAWQQQEKLAPETPIQLHIGIKQRNIKTLEQILLQVSDPKNPSYGKHLTYQQVNQLVSPSPKCIDLVTTWLANHSIQFSATPNSDMLQLDVSAEKAEILLNTNYYFFTHKTSGHKIARVVGGYTLPQHVASCVDFVGPTTRFPNVNSLKVGRSQVGNTPDTLRKLYNIGNTTATNNKTQVAVASFLEQYFSLDDLQIFFKKLYPSQAGKTPNIVGPNKQNEPGLEAELDIQYIMSIGAGANATFWSTAGRQPNNSQNEPFLVWLYNVGNTSNAPTVFSVSYGDNEDSVDFDYALRVNTEFMKAGARGITLLAASGDNGVGGEEGSACKFIPTFPATSPWITAVGGTVGSNPEVGVSFSGGGFSNYFARPDYQNKSVAEYFQNAKGLPPSEDYNHTGAGFPDVSTQAVNFVIVVGGGMTYVDGTSCASPTFAGIVALLNDIRFNQNKSSLGYLNVLLYQNPQVFTDITEGNNPACGTDGFPATVGWDPVTGLGTPLFDKLSSLVSSLN